MKHKGTGSKSFPNVSSKNGGNLPTHNVGDAPGAKGSSNGPMKNGGRYSKGCKVGTVKAK